MSTVQTKNQIVVTSFAQRIVTSDHSDI